MVWFIYVLLGAVFYSARDIFSKKILQKEYSLELLLGSYFIITLISFFFPHSWNISLWEGYLILLRSLAFASAMFFITKAIHHLELSVVSPLLNSSPLILLFLSSLFMPEPINLITILGIVLIVIGTYFLEVHNNYLKVFSHIKEFSNKYSFYVFIGLIFISISALLAKKILFTVQKETFLFYSALFTFLYFLMFFIIQKRSFKQVFHDYHRDSWQIILVGFFGFLFFYLYYSAISYPGALITLIIPLLRTSTLFTVILGGRLFHEDYLIHKIFATIILIIGATLIVIS